MQITLPEAIEQLDAVTAVVDDKVKTGEELVTDKGYHSKQTVLGMQSLGLRTYISEPVGVGSTGSISRPSATRCMPIGGAFGVTAGSY